MCLLRISKEIDYMVLTILLATEEYRICGYAKFTGSILDIGGMGALFGANFAQKAIYLLAPLYKEVIFKFRTLDWV